MAGISKEQLLAEIEDIIRTMPERATIRHETVENLSWLGRASAAITTWNTALAIRFNALVSDIHHRDAHVAGHAIRNALTMLHQARHALRMETVGPATVVVPKGGVFDYFDEVRKVIESAKSDLLFVDPYLDAEFVSRYLPHVTAGVKIRLLGRERMPTLLPAVAMLRQQNGLHIEVRSAGGLHDRFMFVDGSGCYQSGASFKDGAKNAPTTLTQIVDAFPAMRDTYERAWAEAQVQG